MFWFWKEKKEEKGLREELQKSFGAVKRDFSKVGEWIRHIDGKHAEHKDDISKLKDDLLELRAEIEDLKSALAFSEKGMFKQVFKQQQTAVDKQTDVEVVQTPIQTAVQTPFLQSLTVMERAIIWAMLNSDVNLSYEDLAALLGKDKSTIRGQINALRQKSEGLIEEITEKNGKKRLYIPEKVKEILVKSVKVRVKK